MIKMIAPAGSGGAGFEGEFYQANAKGVVEVPKGAVEELRAHGFEIGDVADEPADKRTKNEQLAALAEAVRNAKAELKKDPENAEKKAAVDQAVANLTEAKKG